MLETHLDWSRAAGPNIVCHLAGKSLPTLQISDQPRQSLFASKLKHDTQTAAQRRLPGKGSESSIDSRYDSEGHSNCARSIV